MLDFTEETKPDRFNRLDREIGGFSEEVKNLFQYCQLLKKFGFDDQLCHACVDLWLLIEKEVEQFVLAEKAKAAPKRSP